MPLTTKKLALTFVAAAAAITLAPLGADAATSVTSAPDTAATTETIFTPIGTWQGTVVHGAGTGNVTLTFFVGGRVCLKSSPTDGSGGGGEGVGTWRATGRNTFTYQLRERTFDKNGTTIGFVDVNQNARQVGRAFTSSGISLIYDVNGNLVGRTESRVTAARALVRPAC
jgi:hypothetical protein